MSACDCPNANACFGYASWYSMLIRYLDTGHGHHSTYNLTLILLLFPLTPLCLSPLSLEISFQIQKNIPTFLFFSNIFPLGWRIVGGGRLWGGVEGIMRSQQNQKAKAIFFDKTEIYLQKIWDFSADGIWSRWRSEHTDAWKLLWYKGISNFNIIII